MFQESLTSSVASIDKATQLPGPSEPSGNGAAYDKFLPIYNELRGQTVAVDETASSTRAIDRQVLGSEPSSRIRSVPYPSRKVQKSPEAKCAVRPRNPPTFVIDEEKPALPPEAGVSLRHAGAPFL